MIYFALFLVLVGTIITARGLRAGKKAWVITIIGLLVWWIGTAIACITLDLVVIQVLSQNPFGFDLRNHGAEWHRPPVPNVRQGRVDREG